MKVSQSLLKPNRNQSANVGSALTKRARCGPWSEIHDLGPAMTQITEDSFCFPSDASTLQGTLFIPNETPETVLIVNGATGVAQGYYAHFARWVAGETGMACLTYDYRDFGASLGDQGVVHPKGSLATMADWALGDQPAARRAIRSRFPNARIWVIGHSLGAMLTPIQPEMEQVDRVIGVASGMVHLSDHPWPYRWMVSLFWYGHVPLMVSALGYLPGRLVGFGADLPAPAYWQWRRWCLSRENFYCDVGQGIPDRQWEHPDIQVDFHAFADDKMAALPSVKRLVDRFGPGRATLHEHVPSETGSEIGHLGAFRRANSALWPKLLS